MIITPYTAQHATALADLFHDAVHAIDKSVYTSGQKEAWAPTPPDYRQWADRLTRTQPYVALIHSRVAGFCELESDGHIGCLYTHPDFQRRGVATALYAHLRKETAKRGLSRLYVEASLIARPFFEHRGFVLVRTNKVERQGQTLVNFSMEKRLNCPVAS